MTEMLQSLKLFAKRNSLSFADTDVKRLSNESLCEDKTIDCMYRQCNQCGTTKISSLNLLDPYKEEDISWNTWKTIEGRKTLDEENGTIETLLKHIREDCHKIAIHLYDAEWQLGQMRMAKNNLQPHQVLMIMDFAENFRTMFQNEVASAHWCYQQVTIHPSVCFYRCVFPNCDRLITESVVTISDDMQHDSDAVTVFTASTLDHLSTKTTLNEIVEFTDGAASQYKSRKPFIHLAKSKVPVTRSYFGS